MIDINGIAHIQLSVRDFATARAHYHAICHETFGMAIQYDQPDCFYCIGGRTGIMITPAEEPEDFNPRRAGLHHICFRLRSPEDVDILHARLVEIGATIVRAPEVGPWAEGYYSILWEDPDGIRLEANHVPGRGNLDRLSQGPISDRYSES